jgi:hypothetical protein
MGIAVSIDRGAENIWMCQSWIGCWLFELAMERCRNHPEAAKNLELSSFCHGVSLDRLRAEDPAMERATTGAFLLAIDDVLQGKEDYPWRSTLDPEYSAESPELRLKLNNHLIKLRELLQRWNQTIGEEPSSTQSGEARNGVE